MLATRFVIASTHDNLTALTTLIRDAKCEEIRLFASPMDEIGNGANLATDGIDTNYPLVAALATYNIPGITKVHVVFDGVFLTAARAPRIREVQIMLNEAMASGKAGFGVVRVPFTSAMSPQAAATAMLKIPTHVLEPDSRAKYFAMLSTLPEPI